MSFRFVNTALFLPVALGSLLVIESLLGASAAHADGYIGAGIGANSELSGEISDHFSTDGDATSSRVLVGERFGALAFEGSLFGSQLRGISGLTGTGDSTTISLGLDVKYYIGLFGGLEGYGKIGLNKTWLAAADGMDASYEGRGKALGLGLQYSFNLPLTEVGLWVDYTAQDTELRSADGPNLDGNIEMVNFGVSVGF